MHRQFMQGMREQFKATQQRFLNRLRNIFVQNESNLEFSQISSNDCHDYLMNNNSDQIYNNICKYTNVNNYQIQTTQTYNQRRNGGIFSKNNAQNNINFKQNNKLFKEDMEIEQMPKKIKAGSKKKSLKVIEQNGEQQKIENNQQLLDDVGLQQKSQQFVSSLNNIANTRNAKGIIVRKIDINDPDQVNKPVEVMVQQLSDIDVVISNQMYADHGVLEAPKITSKQLTESYNRITKAQIQTQTTNINQNANQIPADINMNLQEGIIVRKFGDDANNKNYKEVVVKQISEVEKVITKRMAEDDKLQKTRLAKKQAEAQVVDDLPRAPKPKLFQHQQTSMENMKDQVKEKVEFLKRQAKSQSDELKATYEQYVKNSVQQEETLRKQREEEESKSKDKKGDDSNNNKSKQSQNQDQSESEEVGAKAMVDKLKNSENPFHAYLVQFDYWMDGLRRFGYEQYELAKVQFLKDLQIRIELFGELSEPTANTYKMLLSTYLRLIEQLQQAQVTQQQQVQQSQATQTQSTQESDIKDQQSGDTQTLITQYEEEIRMIYDKMDLYVSVPGNIQEANLVAEFYAAFTEMCLNRRDYAKAIDYAKRELQIMLKLQGDVPPVGDENDIVQRFILHPRMQTQIYTAFRSQATAQALTLEYDQAILNYKKALEYIDNFKDKLNISQCYKALGDYKSALTWLQDSKHQYNISTKGSGPVLQRLSVEMAHLLELMNRWEEAAACYGNAADALHKRVGQFAFFHTVDAALYYSKTAQCYQRIPGKEEEASLNMERCLEIAEIALEPEQAKKWFQLQESDQNTNMNTDVINKKKQQQFQIVLAEDDKELLQCETMNETELRTGYFDKYDTVKLANMFSEDQALKKEEKLEMNAEEEDCHDRDKEDEPDDFWDEECEKHMNEHVRNKPKDMFSLHQEGVHSDSDDGDFDY